MKDQISQVLRAVPSRNHRWSVQLRHLRTLPVTFLPYICFLSNLHNNKKPTKKLTLSQMCCQYYITPEPPRQKETKWTLHRTVRPKPTGRHTSLSLKMRQLSCESRGGLGERAKRTYDCCSGKELLRIQWPEPWKPGWSCDWSAESGTWTPLLHSGPGQDPAPPETSMASILNIQSSQY